MNIVIHSPKDHAILKIGAGVLRERLEQLRTLRNSESMILSSEDLLMYNATQRAADDENLKLESMIWRLERLVDDMEAVIEDYEEILKKNEEEKHAR